MNKTLNPIPLERLFDAEGDDLNFILLSLPGVVDDDSFTLYGYLVASMIEQFGPSFPAIQPGDETEMLASGPWRPAVEVTKETYETVTARAHQIAIDILERVA